MVRPSVPACALLLGCIPFHASAQAIDPEGAEIRMGQPLDLPLRIRPAPELGAGRIGRHCLHARLRYGARQIENRQVQVQIGEPDEDGITPVRLRHPARVDEPVVSVRLHLGCGAEYTREFDLLALPPADLPRAATSTASRRASPDIHQGGTTRPTTDAARATHSSSVNPATQLPPRPAKSPSQNVSPATAAASTAGASASLLAGPGDWTVLENDLPATSAGVAAPSTSPPSPANSAEQVALMRSVSRLLAAAGLPGRELAPPSAAPTATASHAAEARAELAYMSEELQRLTQAQRAHQGQLAALQARLSQAEETRMHMAAWAVLLLLGSSAAIYGLASAWHRLQSRRLRRLPTTLPHGASPRGDQTATEEPAWFLHKKSTAPLRGPDLSPTGGDQGGMAAGGAPDLAASRQTTALPPDLGIPFDDAALTLPTASASSSGGPRSLPNRWEGSSFGRGTLDPEVVAPIRASIETAITQGYHGFAAAALEHCLGSPSGKHPWALLKLLEIYQALEQPDNHDRVRAEIEALFNLHAPAYREGGPAPGSAGNDGHAIAAGDELLDHWPPAWTAWLTIWPSVAAASHLAGWLLAHPSRGKVMDTAEMPRHPRLDLREFYTLLFLYEVALLRDTPDGAPADLPGSLPPLSAA